MNSRSKIITLAFGHGLNDLLAGYFIGNFASDNKELIQVGLAITLYNVLAFGGQYLVAILLEKMNDTKKFIVFAYLINVIAVSIFILSPVFAIILAGIASAIYHVAGGAYCAENNKAFNIGLFAAPGVAGLIAGGYLAWKSFNIIPILLPVSAIFFLVLLKMKIESTAIQKNISAPGKQRHSIDNHDILMILLLIIISLRSVTWNIFQLIHENNYEWLASVAVAAVIGKLAGGWLADKIGWRFYALSSTIIATPLITFFRKELLLFCIGVGLLQSGIPATTSLLITSVKGKTAKAIALSFGAAIVLGSIANIFPLEQLIQDMPFILLTSIILLWICTSFYKRMTQRLV